ncbi:MAG: hypothetical protein D6714_12275 [Bacteroidetes bacterium]|nr:MAG: hypothetical protein D6714_12275 [Bacteroidota bacterium]
MEQPSIFFWGFEIAEPVTAATDLLVSAVCFYAWRQLARRPLPNRAYRYYTWYFLTMGIATFLGGILGHALIHAIPFHWKLPGWLISMISVTLAERASIAQAAPLLKPRFVSTLKIANWTELGLFLGIVFYTLDFNFVGVHSAFSLLFVLFPIHFFIYRKSHNPGSLLFLRAVALATVAYVIYISKTGFGPWFNHLDISHVIMAYCAWLFYRGVLKMGLDNHPGPGFKKPSGVHSPAHTTSPEYSEHLL